MKKLLCIALIAIFFTQCKSDQGWTASEKEKTIKTCMEGMEGKLNSTVAKNYCSCVLEQAMKKYKNYADLDKRGTEEEGRKMGMSCISELTPAMPKTPDTENNTDSIK